ncbi:FecR domain-containing protein [Novosphingobium sp. Fuku2-ISO-50]|uniref:FecR family protein n=1 Tax=Novosphingobium sp. Fuku2-ISO-50 TaxID=1739114 RepID=UPI00076D3A24|nr:FecR domain-containing protein [Novosphingobium sp. Fuku2-ISO-50]KUR75365.1 hypothetical protein AQZ50_16045 [Novosphingobium sp. Fuku2-ISO-50]
MTDAVGDVQDETSGVEDEAIAWLVRMRGPDAAVLKGRFEAWLSQSPEHRRAHEWAVRHFDDAGILKQSARHGAGSGRIRPVARWLVGSALVAAAASIALVLFGNPFGRGGADAPKSTPALASSLATRHGEIRTFRLADGSLATLDTDSKLSVAMDGSTRHLELEQGKARFIISRDSRPFLVTAGAGTVSATAATFDVGYDNRQIMVRLISGSAEVQPVVRPAVYTAPARHVLAGHNLCYRASDFQAMPPPSRLSEVNDAGWPSGWVEYRAVPLAVLIEQANRYAEIPVVLDGATSGSLEASGRFRLTDTDAFVGRIAEVFGLDVSRRADGIHLTPK